MTPSKHATHYGWQSRIPYYNLTTPNREGSHKPPRDTLSNSVDLSPRNLQSYPADLREEINKIRYNCIGSEWHLLEILGKENIKHICSIVLIIEALAQKCEHPIDIDFTLSICLFVHNIENLSL